MMPGGVSQVPDGAREALTEFKLAGHKTDDGYVFWSNEVAAARALDALSAAGYAVVKVAARRILPDGLRGGGPCDYCGTPDNIIWFTDSVFWNAVIRTGDNQHEGFMCPTCFVKRVDEAGYYPTGWRLVPEWHWETTQERTVRMSGDSP